MVDVITGVVGALLVLLIFADAFSTTVVVAEGPGPLTRRVMGLLWRGVLRLHRRDSESSLLSVAGPTLLITTVLLWVLGLWAGWTLIFLSGTDAVVGSRSQVPAGLGDVVYYSGFTVFTLGTGDYVAATVGWRIASAVASFSGLFLVTLAITYLISVVSAVVQRRTLAIAINALGSSADDIVRRGWTGHGFSPGFTQQLVHLSDKLAGSAEQHLAYPVLHYFHAHHRPTSAPLALARLEDVLLVLTAGLAPSARPDASTTEPLRYVLERYVTAAAVASALPRRTAAPPTPGLHGLADRGIPLVPADRFEQAAAEDADRRIAMRELVNGDGWSWPDSGG